jgi:hypothetical protein
VPCLRLCTGLLLLFIEKNAKSVSGFASRLRFYLLEGQCLMDSSLAVGTGKTEIIAARPERRIHARHHCHELYGTALEVGAEQAWWAHVVDVSKEGIGLTLPQSLRLGTILTLDLRTLIERDLPPLRVRVVRVTLEREGRWRTGCVFVGTPDDAQFQSLTRNGP